MKLFLTYLKQKINANQAPKDYLDKNQGSGLFFNDFNDGFWQQTCLILITLRDVFLSFTLVFLASYPLAQAILMLISSVVVIAYLMIFRPPKQVRTFIQILVMEIIVLISNVYLLLLVIWDHQEGDHSIHNPSLAIIILNFIYIVISLIAAVVEFGIAVNELCQKGKLKTSPETMTQPFDLQTQSSMYSPTERRFDFSSRSFTGEESNVRLKGSMKTAGGRVQPPNLNESITYSSPLENHEAVNGNRGPTVIRGSLRDRFRRSLNKDIEQEGESPIKFKLSDDPPVRYENRELYPGPGPGQSNPGQSGNSELIKNLIARRNNL